MAGGISRQRLPAGWTTLQARLSHLGRVENLLQFLCAELRLLQRYLADGLASFRCLLHQPGGLIVADDRRERGAVCQATFHHVRAFAGGPNANDTLRGEVFSRGCQQRDGLQQVIGRDRHHYVDLEIARLPGNGDCRVIAHYLSADHADGFGDDRVDLAWHDGTARLHGGKLDFAEARAWARAEPASVVGNFHQAHGQGIERAARGNDIIQGALRLEVVAGFVDEDAVQFGKTFADPPRKLGMRVDPRTNGGATQRDLGQFLLRQAHALDAALDLPGIAAKLLAEPDGCRVLKVRAARLDDIHKLDGFLVERAFQDI